MGDDDGKDCQRKLSSDQILNIDRRKSETRCLHVTVVRGESWIADPCRQHEAVKRESAAWRAAKSGAPFSSRAQISPSMIASGRFEPDLPVSSSRDLRA